MPNGTQVTQQPSQEEILALIDQGKTDEEIQSFVDNYEGPAAPEVAEVDQEEQIYKLIDKGWNDEEIQGYLDDKASGTPTARTIAAEDEDENAIYDEDYEKNYFEGTFGKLLNTLPFGIGDYIDDSGRAIGTGLAQGASVDEALELMIKSKNASDEDIAEYVEAANRAKDVQASKEYMDFQKTYEEEGKTVWGFLKGLSDNPSVVSEIALTSLVSMLNPTSIGSGLAAGGAVGLATGGVGALPAGMAAMSATLDSALSFNEFVQEELEHRGLEFNEKNVKSLMNDKEAINTIRAKAAKRGLVVGAIDGITAGLAGKVGKSVLGAAGKAASRGRKVGAATAGLGVEATGGAAGESAARVAAGQEQDVAEIGLEFFGELGPGSISVGKTLFATPDTRPGAETPPPKYQTPLADNAGVQDVSKEIVDEIIDTSRDLSLLENINIENDTELEAKRVDRIHTVSAENKVADSKDFKQKDPKFRVAAEIQKQIDIEKAKDNDGEGVKNRLSDLRQAYKYLTNPPEKKADGTVESKPKALIEAEKATTDTKPSETQQSHVERRVKEIVKGSGRKLAPKYNKDGSISFKKSKDYKDNKPLHNIVNRLKNAGYPKAKVEVGKTINKIVKGPFDEKKFTAQFQFAEGERAIKNIDPKQVKRLEEAKNKLSEDVSIDEAFSPINDIVTEQEFENYLEHGDLEVPKALRNKPTKLSRIKSVRKFLKNEGEVTEHSKAVDNAFKSYLDTYENTRNDKKALDNSYESVSEFFTKPEWKSYVNEAFEKTDAVREIANLKTPEFEGTEFGDLNTKLHNNLEGLKDRQDDLKSEFEKELPTEVDVTNPVDPQKPAYLPETTSTFEEVVGIIKKAQIIRQARFIKLLFPTLAAKKIAKNLANVLQEATEEIASGSGEVLYVPLFAKLGARLVNKKKQLIGEVVKVKGKPDRVLKSVEDVTTADLKEAQLRAGHHLMSVLMQKGVIDIKRDNDSTWAPYTLVINNQTYLDNFIRGAGQNVKSANKWSGVLFDEPKGFDGAEHETGLDLISHAHPDQLVDIDPRVLEAINNAIKTQYKTNTTLLPVLLSLKEKGAKFLNFNKEHNKLTKFIQTVATNPEQEQAVRDALKARRKSPPKKGKADKSHALVKDFISKKKWADFSFEASKQLDGIESKERARDEILFRAAETGKKPWYQLFKYGFRGRIYAAANYFNSQGQELAKSLIKLGKPKALGTVGWAKLLISAQDSFGYSNIGQSMENRFDAASASGNLEKWVKIASDPVNHMSDIEAAKEPMLFLAAINEIRDAMSSGDVTTFESSFILQQDATASGPQWLGGFVRDEKGALVLNLEKDGVRQDLYTTVGKPVIDGFPDSTLEERESYSDTMNELQELYADLSKAVASNSVAEVNSIREELNVYVDNNEATIHKAYRAFMGNPDIKEQFRDIVKSPIMTRYYTAGATVMARDLVKKFAFDDAFKGNNILFMELLSGQLIDETSKVLPGPAVVMEHIQKWAIKIHNKKKLVGDQIEGENFKFKTNTSGFQMVMDPREALDPVDLELPYSGISEDVGKTGKGGHQTIGFKATLGDGVQDADAIRSGSVANFTHTNDPSPLVQIFLNDEYDMSPIHDSIGTLAADSQKAYTDFRKGYVDTLKSNPILQLLKQNFTQLEVIELYSNLQEDLEIAGIEGTMDLNGPMENQYFAGAGPVEPSGKAKFSFSEEADNNRSNIDEVVGHLKEKWPGIEIITDEQGIKNTLKSAGKDPELFHKTKGAYVNGKVILNPLAITPDTPFHEVGHAYLEGIQESDPALYSAALELSKKSPTYAKIKEHPNYQNLTEEEILNEVLATDIGVKGSELFSKASDISAWNSFVSKVKSIVANALNIDIGTYENLTYGDFINLSASQVISGTEVSTTVDSNISTIFGSKGIVLNEKDVSEAKQEGKKATKSWFKNFYLKWLSPAAADDFHGLIQRVAGINTKAAKFIQKNITDPYVKGYHSYINASAGVRASIDSATSGLKEAGIKMDEEYSGTIQGRKVTNAQALKALSGLDELGNTSITKEEMAQLKSLYETPAVKNFIDTLVNEGVFDPKDSINYAISSIDDNVNSYIRTTLFKQKLSDFIDAKEKYFNKAAMNTIRANKGNEYADALQSSLDRMSGKNTFSGKDKTTQQLETWLTGSVGVIMFLNFRSAALQMISVTNYASASKNAAKFFANLFNPSTYVRAKEIFNSPYLKERRARAGYDVNANELFKIMEQRGFNSAVKWLLKKGFYFTGAVDSLAIALGGAAFIKAQESSNVPTEEAIKQWKEQTEEAQQSARPDRVSEWQSSGGAKYVLAFANTPAQYFRLAQKASRALTSRTATAAQKKKAIADIATYMVLQNAIFTALQGAMEGLFDDDDEGREQREAAANSMLDSILRGMGIYGAVFYTGRQVLAEAIRQEGKANPDHIRTALKAAQLSPVISKKITDLLAIGNAWKYDRNKTGVESPIFTTTAEGLSFVANVPADWLQKKSKATMELWNEQYTAWQKILLLAGWSEYNLSNSDINLNLRNLRETDPAKFDQIIEQRKEKAREKGERAREKARNR